MAKVLIVDDSSIDRFIIKKCIENNGHRIVGEASNSIEAIEQYRKLSPDVVFLDIVMPNDNGISILKDLLLLDSDARIVMCTSAALQNIVIEAIQIGAKSFLVKPITNNSVKNAFLRALKD